MNDSPQQLARELAVNEAKLKVLRAYGAAFEWSIIKLAKALARDGYSQDEIVEAIRATHPTLQAGIADLEARVELCMAGSHG